MHEPNLHSCSSLHNQQTPIKKSLLDVVEGTNSAKSFKVSLDNPIDQVLIKSKTQLPDLLLVPCQTCSKSCLRHGPLQTCQQKHDLISTISALVVYGRHGIDFVAVLLLSVVLEACDAEKSQQNTKHTLP